MVCNEEKDKKKKNGFARKILKKMTPPLPCCGAWQGCCVVGWDWVGQELESVLGGGRGKVIFAG